MTEEEQGGIVREARNLIEEYVRPDIRTIEEPNTGTKALIALSGGGYAPIDSHVFDSYRERPLRLRGTAVMLSIDSTIEHINRFKDLASVVFADDSRTAPSITAVYDYHEPANDFKDLASVVFADDSRTAPSITAVYDYHEPANDGGVADGNALADATDIARHMLHRSKFDFPLSDEWKAWTKLNATPMKMVEFAEFVEERLPDVIDLIPGEDELGAELQKFISASGGDAIIAGSAKLYELSRGLRINEESVIKEVNNLSSGEAQVVFESEHRDAGGLPLRVPSLFLIAIPVFRNDALYRLAARLRYRKTPAGIVFWYDLWRADRAFDDAFRLACERVRVETGLPLLFGKPEA